MCGLIFIEATAPSLYCRLGVLNDLGPVLLGAGNEYPPPFNSILKPELTHPLRVETIFSVFAFKTDLSVKTEWERYRELVESENKSPGQVYINDICVAGYGYWKSLCEEGVRADEDIAKS